ncbi:MAG: hypothetical protein ACFFBP_14050 [Promethearchaeota archaeon]
MRDSLILKFEGKYFGQILKRLWIIGQHSTIIFLAQRVFIFLLVDLFTFYKWLDFLKIFIEDEDIYLFSFCLLLFVLVSLLCIILAKLVWKIPYGYYFIGKKSDWINVEKMVIDTC